jgi:hypothetical protein
MKKFPLNIEIMQKTRRAGPGLDVDQQSGPLRVNDLFSE